MINVLSTVLWTLSFLYNRVIFTNALRMYSKRSFLAVVCSFNKRVNFKKFSKLSWWWNRFAKTGIKCILLKYFVSYFLFYNSTYILCRHESSFLKEGIPTRKSWQSKKKFSRRRVSSFSKEHPRILIKMCYCRSPVRQ